MVIESADQSAPVVETEVKQEPPKLALAISKRDWYEWAENTAFASKHTSHPVRGEDILIAQLDETCTKEFFSLPTALLIRPQCETNEDFLQVLPYVILRVPGADDENHVQVFAYQRGKKGTEARLHGDYSIGFGGHMEEQPNKDLSFLDAIVDCVCRELLEEVGLNLKPLQVLNALGKGVVFHDCSNDVGKVHLALTMVIDVTDNQLIGQEIDQVDNVQKLFAKDMLKRANAGEIRLESWTRILLDNAWNYWYNNGN